MRPVDQTIFVNDPRSIPGDCLRACVASLWDLPLEAVPHFALYRDWRTALIGWLDDRGAIMRLVWTDRAGDVSPRWPGQPLLAFGRSPRGVSHAVVWLDRVLHDPHPSRDGFEGEPYEVYDILPAPEPQAVGSDG